MKLQDDNELGCAPGEKPAFSISLLRYVFDILHMKFRITERFLLLFVQRVIEAVTTPKEKFVPGIAAFSALKPTQTI